MAMKLGMQTGQQDCSYEDLRRVWRLADSSGVYWVSVWDHFYSTVDPKGSCFEGVSIMAALAAETTNVRVGCLVFGMGYRNPAVLAKAAITIDHVSNGRLELGLGAGWHELEHTAYGIPFPPMGLRMDIFEEGVQVIRSMLTQESTTFSGRHFHLNDASSYPRPVQRRPRLWIGGQGEQRTLRIVARYGDGWNAPFISPGVFKRKAEALDRWCAVEERDPVEIARSVNVGFYMGANEADARRMRNRYQKEWGRRADERSEGMLLGTPSQVIERIGAYADTGAQGLNINLRAPFPWDALQAFVEEVVPAFA